MYGSDDEDEEQTEMKPTKATIDRIVRVLREVDEHPANWPDEFRTDCEFIQQRKRELEWDQESKSGLSAWEAEIQAKKAWVSSLMVEAKQDHAPDHGFPRNMWGGGILWRTQEEAEVFALWCLRQGWATCLNHTEVRLPLRCTGHKSNCPCNDKPEDLQSAHEWRQQAIDKFEASR